jgi:methionyl-tRNA formyltransferase
LASIIIKLEGNELFPELKNKQAKATFDLCMEFMQNSEQMIRNKRKQTGISSYYRKRTPSDSCLDLNKTILDQFNLLRVVDNESYPAYFYHAGRKYVVKIYAE